MSAVAPVDLKIRTKQYALRIIRMYTSLPSARVAQTIGHQLLRSGTSVGANYREAVRARSRAEFATKLNIGLMELEETMYWLELLEEAAIFPGNRLADLRGETNELCAIFVTLIKKSKKQN